jgi:16S rRNA processing protein RimM
MPRSRSSSSTDTPLLEVGRVDRPHGIRGEVAVSLVTNRVERLAPGAVLQTDNGPLTVRSSRPHKGRHLVVFEGVHTREAAEDLKGTVLLGEPIDDPDEVWVHDLIGSRLIDQHGVDRGCVVGVIANPASDLLELDSGALVPMGFVVTVEPGQPIEVDVPRGLFDEDDVDAPPGTLDEDEVEPDSARGDS